MSQTVSYSIDRATALALARSGACEDWRDVCRKMMFDGWGIQLFNDGEFIAALDLACSMRVHAVRGRPTLDRSLTQHNILGVGGRCGPARGTEGFHVHGPAIKR